MIIRGVQPQLTMLRSRGQVVFHYLSHGRVRVQKWPRKRGNNIPLITQLHVVTWDAVQAWLPHIAISEQTLAYALTTGTAFYARDMLIMASYGHLVGWPGYGPQPGEIDPKR